MKKLKSRKQNRFYAFDYRKNAMYFVTSCTKNRINHFGNINENKMILNSFGDIVKKQWNWLTIQYPYLISHAFIVMPNHIHGILEINDLKINNQTINPLKFPIPFSNNYFSNQLHRIDRIIETPEQENIKIKSLSELMGAFKTTSSKEIHLLGNKEFAWQRSFHDRIIRNHLAYKNIVNYIKTNPKRWKEDSLFKFPMKG